MNFSTWSIKNPIPSVMLFVLLTLAGLMGFRAMKVQQFPDLELPVVTVTATLPGASPTQLETEVVRKIEDSVAAISGVKHIHAKVQDSSAVISVEFRLEKPTQEAVDAARISYWKRYGATLLGMIKHHQGAIDMLSMISSSTNPEVVTLRENIRKTQTAEIKQMQDLLKKY